MTSQKAARLAYDVAEPKGHNESQMSPIILLHGLTQTRHSWHELFQDIADKTGRKVYLVDARNHGDSEWINEHTCQCLAQDVSHFMNEHGISSAVIVGHSMGGLTGMFLATTEPKKVEKLVVEDISSRFMEEDKQKFLRGMLKLLQASLSIISPDEDLSTAKKRIREHFQAQLPPAFRNSPQKDLSYLLPLQKTADGFSWKLNFDAFQTETFFRSGPENDIRGSYDGPTLFVYGTASHIKVVDDKEIILKTFPNATFKAIEGATHAVHNEYPKEFLETVLDFLN